MHYSVILYSLLLFQVTNIQAGPTLVITGSEAKNAAKINFLKKYLDGNKHIVEEFNSEIVIIDRQNADSIDADLEFSQHFAGIDFPGNLSTIIFLDKPFYNLEGETVRILELMLNTERGLVLVDFDSKPSQPYMESIADCQLKTKAVFNESNVVYLCNDNEVYKMVPFIAAPEEKSQVDVRKQLAFPSGGVFYAEAAKAENRHKKHKKEVEADDEKERLEDEIQEIVEKTMKIVEKRKKPADDSGEEDDDDDDDDDDNEFDNKHDPKRDHRLHCKYRKSCYETGKRGLIEKYDFSFNHLFHFWRAPESQQHHLSKHEDADQDGIPDSEDDDVDLADRKLVCKYRTSCYRKHDIPLSDKLKEKERSFISAKLAPPQGKKRTLKEIAAKAVSGVEKREDEAKSRPVPKSMIVEKKLKEIDDHLQKKLNCKYRKSCYETGDLPEIEESSFSIPFVNLEIWNSDSKDDDDEKEQKPYEEMEDLEKKHYCKYRKSCYETGQKPEIDSEFHVESIRDIFEAAEQVETRKLTLQERCKYRKSCYKTGVLPDLGNNDDEHIEKIAKKEVSSVVPSTVQDLKHLCKYRKSCYQEIAVSQSADIVQTIRKRRIIETEVRKRRTRRHRRAHKRRHMITRYGMTEADHVEKTQKEIQDSNEARENRKQETPVPAQKPTKTQGNKKSKGKSPSLAENIVEEVIAQKIVEAVIEAEEEDREKEEKKVEKVEKDNDDDDDEEEDQKPKKSLKKNKNIKKAEPEEEKPSKNSKKLVKRKPAQKPIEVEDDDDDDEDDTPEPVVKVVVAPKVHVSSKQSKKVVQKDDSEEDDKDDDDEKKESLKKKEDVDDDKDDDDDDDDEDEPAAKNVKVAQTVKSQKKPDSKEDDDDDDDDDDEEPIAKKVTVAQPVKSQKKRDSKEDDDDDDDDEGNEFDNQHDPKRDHRLHCKYRKSCYETGNLGMIEPYDFSLDHIFHFWRAPPSQQHHNFRVRDSDGDGIPDHEDKDTSMVARKLLCKYRASCYQKYNIPIEEKFLERESKRSEESADRDGKNGEDDDDDDEAEEKKVDLDGPNHKLECKYRKSCYDSGVLPPLQQWSESPKDEDDDDDEAEEKKVDLDAPDHKLGCKYRRSCYDSGVLPTIQQWSKAPSLADAIESSDRDKKFHQCKYRKSCYAKIGIIDKDSEEEITEKEEERKPHLKEPAVQKKEVKEQEHKHQKNEHKKHSKKDKEKKKQAQEEEDDDDDKEDKKKSKKSADEKKSQKIVEEIQRQEQVHDQETESVNEIHLSTGQKYHCKYRKSCYSTIDPKAAKQDHSGTMARRAGSDKKCHIYYLSCREAMGLPPKEKAPMGPNGKRLCRKVKKSAE